MSQFTWPPISTTSGPVQFTKNAVTTTVSLDTVTPANSTPLPVSQLNSSGVVIDPATSTNQLTEITALGTLNTSVNTLLKPASTLAAVTTLGSITNPLPAGTNVIGHVIVDSSGLPTGAATASNQTSGSQKTQVVNSIGTSVDAKLLSVQVAGTDVGLITNSVIRGLTTAGGGTYVDVKVNPSGALSVDASGSTGLVLAAGTAIIGKVSIDQTTPGTTNGVQINAALPAGTNAIGSVLINGKSRSNVPARNDYTSVSVTTAAYVQLVAATSSLTNEIEIFDSSGQTMALAFGAAASEIDQIYIFPGGNGRVPLSIPAGTRVSIRAISATASVGEIDINFYA